MTFAASYSFNLEILGVLNFLYVVHSRNIRGATYMYIPPPVPTALYRLSCHRAPLTKLTPCKNHHIYANFLGVQFFVYFRLSTVRDDEKNRTVKALF